MAMIEYIESGTSSIGSLIAGIALLIMIGTIMYIFYRLYIKFIKYMDIVIRRMSKYEILEEIALDRVAKKQGIDLSKELHERYEIEEQNNIIFKSSFRKKLEKKIIEEAFSK